MKTLSLPQYDISIGPIGESHYTWLRARHYAGLAVLVDDNTAEHCWPRLAEGLAEFRPRVIRIPAGELHKHLDTCRHIWEELFAAGAGRNWCLLNLGGGVIGDMGGFCAGTFKRGMDFVQVPTTLLSQVDASVGGKLGIDFHDIKNSIGLFRDPAAVWADPAFFATLPPREVRSGFAEIVKHALIASAEQWARLQSITDLADVNWIDWVADSVAIKRDVVEEDPHEKGLRKALNFGHTIGHAIESYFLASDTPLLHGEAIAAGMIAEAWLSERQAGLTPPDLAAITRYLLRIYGHQAVPEEAFATLITYMRQDKKNEDSRINFSLLPAPGAVAVNQTAEPAVIAEALRYYNSCA
ncbi:MAG: 3-dehydroquinate synthase [Lewinella sp.]|nr:3-dehydroquinate synthase [Lewinella sp.]